MPVNAPRISQDALDQLFMSARTHNGWLDTPVSDDKLKEVYDIAKMGATSMNTQPMRLVFVRTPEARERLSTMVSPGNVDKVRQAPVIVIFANDSKFYEYMPKIWFREGAKEMFEGNPAMAAATATRNATLQAAYFMIAARAVGLDCGPMSGFDIPKVNAEYFADGRYQANFICALGFGDESKLFERQPRLAFEEVSTLL
ncbi:malonic semialdehyde reductase [Pigmentiphaga litoralis]|uniref:3-hydroxypropanoate dehydrogenase n=1 Tax=Pigmentiphaga litoralis TaxID=516702 RepID=A0A7Y9LQI6_9BURK|nr:malonic semialdehyde reductase [Pigmentiphaga litoralis]NYE26774.1 3-hydroxypropanoate dehydrogenase [Pigmentiphaga litoralis]NYE85816.1 3-hydroxypropanoate dehydrogenase [Pigmentiphaga litoralis]